MLHYNFRSSRKFEDVIFWRSCSGRGVIGKKFDLVLEQNEKMKTYLQEVNLFSGCTEATQNATVHAYIAKRKLSLVDHEKCSWWIFSQIKKNVLTVCVCDLGVGIARTLPQKYAFYDTILKQLPEKAGASELIKKAIEEPSSRTHEDHRGNGLKTIAQVAQNKDGASLKILSSKACVLVSKQGIFTHDYSNEVPGTIIAWTLPLGEDE